VVAPEILMVFSKTFSGSPGVIITYGAGANKATVSKPKNILRPNLPLLRLVVVSSNGNEKRNVKKCDQIVGRFDSGRRKKLTPEKLDLLLILLSGERFLKSLKFIDRTRSLILIFFLELADPNDITN
jgi:hypothetical protein